MTIDDDEGYLRIDIRFGNQEVSHTFDVEDSIHELDKIRDIEGLDSPSPEAKAVATKLYWDRVIAWIAGKYQKPTISIATAMKVQKGLFERVALLRKKPEGDEAYTI
jgi:hypothetical protein